MSSQQVQIQQGTDNQEGGSGRAGGGSKNPSSSSFMCRQQSSSRWTPTTDQIRILKDLYYNNGVRSPSADQIQRISSKLSQYGKIEGKNVFYWFQNHKARERQKKRLFTSNNHHHRSPTTWHHQDHLLHHQHHYHLSNLTNNNNMGYFPASSGSCSPLWPPGSGIMNVYGGYDSSSSSPSSSMAMEKNFRECSITTPRGNGGSSMGHSFTWIGAEADPYTPYSFLDTRKYTHDDHQTIEVDHQEDEEEEENNDTPSDIETLSLFPMHGQDMLKHQHRVADNGGGGSRASLELTLNTYAA